MTKHCEGIERLASIWVFRIEIVSMFFIVRLRLLLNNGFLQVTKTFKFLYLGTLTFSAYFDLSPLPITPISFDKNTEYFSISCSKGRVMS